MDLVRDLLDKKVVDRNGREMGRVDRIVLDVREGAPPRVAAFEIGPSALAARLGARLGRWAAAIEHGFQLREVLLRPIVDQQVEFSVRLRISETEGQEEAVALAIRQRVRAHMIDWILRRHAEKVWG